MATMTIRMSEEDAELVRRYASFEGKSISDFARDAIFETIEDRLDVSDLRRAIAEDDGTRYSQDQVLAELGL